MGQSLLKGATIAAWLVSSVGAEIIGLATARELIWTFLR
jgi:hypothetical protein